MGVDDADPTGEMNVCVVSTGDSALLLVDSDGSCTDVGAVDVILTCRIQIKECINLIFAFWYF